MLTVNAVHTSINSFRFKHNLDPLIFLKFITLTPSLLYIDMDGIILTTDQAALLLLEAYHLNIIMFDNKLQSIL